MACRDLSWHPAEQCGRIGRVAPVLPARVARHVRQALWGRRRSARAVREQPGKMGGIKRELEARRLGHRRRPEGLGLGLLGTDREGARGQQDLGQRLQSRAGRVAGACFPELDRSHVRADAGSKVALTQASATAKPEHQTGEVLDGS